MTEFQNLCYFNAAGLFAPIDQTHPDNPYFGSTALARSVLGSDMRFLGWSCSGKVVRLEFASRVIAALDPDSKLLVVVVQYADPQFKRPRNAVVVDSTGAILSQIEPPLFVERDSGSLSGERAQSDQYLVEYVDSVQATGGRIVLDLGFDYQWIERRLYDVKVSAWAERECVFRK